MRAAPWGEEREGWLCKGGGEQRRVAASEGARQDRRQDRRETWSEDRKIEGREEAGWRMREKNYAKRLSRIC